MKALVSFVLAVSLASPAAADDYCEHVQAVAEAQSDLLFAPRVFGTFGYTKQPDDTTVVDPVVTAGPRVTAGIDYELTNIVKGSATRGRARAECKRHASLEQIASAPAYRALEARARVLEAALPEADRILAQVEAEVTERLATEKELIATRLRADELRSLARETHRQLAAMPVPSGRLAGALATYYAADGEVEQHDARLRKLEAFDVKVRVGYDRFLDRTDEAPYFALLSIGINLGVLFQSGANERAGAARARMVRGPARGLIETTGQLEAQLASDAKRLAETAALVADLEAQLDAIAKLGGDDGRRYRQTLWFELVKVRAEHQYVSARMATVREVLGT
jgi:hypothetical protein